MQALASALSISLPEPSTDTPLDDTALALAQAYGRNAASLPLVEALHTVSSLYPTLLANGIRSELGAFYTPPVLVKRLIDHATDVGVDWRQARVLDPAAGAGAFLVQVALHMREALSGCEPKIAVRQIGQRLTGFEIDPAAAELGQRALEIALFDLTKRADTKLPLMLRTCNSLEQTPRADIDLVIGNPPYGRVSLNPTQRKHYSRSLFGHANLYGVFTDLALRWTKDGGHIAYLTPTSFLGGQYYSALRGLLADEAPPVAIDFVHDRRHVFEDVQQETLLAIYKKGGSRTRAQIHYLHVKDEGEIQIKKNGTVALPADAKNPWLAPRDAKQGALIAAVEKMPLRLADFGYSVSTGPLVWNRFKPQLRDKLSSRPVYPLIWAECVMSGGRFAYQAKRRNHAPAFLLEPGDEWLLVEKPCVLVQRTTAKEQNRRLIAAELPAAFVRKHGGVVVENHLNMVWADTPRVSSKVIAALLNSEVVDELFRCISGSVAVSAFELAAVPMPDADQCENLERLLNKNADQKKIEAECRKLYGGVWR
jgi:adenine-specific DNA-methyltransferase